MLGDLIEAPETAVPLLPPCGPGLAQETMAIDRHEGAHTHHSTESAQPAQSLAQGVTGSMAPPIQNVDAMPPRAPLQPTADYFTQPPLPPRPPAVCVHDDDPFAAQRALQQKWWEFQRRMG